MKIQVIHERDPDTECYLTVWVDGIRSEIVEEDIDPGRGWEWEDWFERIKDAHTDAAGKPADSYEVAVFTALVSGAESQHVSKPDDWRDLIDNLSASNLWTPDEGGK